MKKSDVIFIAVGTPQGPTGHANLEFVKLTAKGIAKALDRSRSSSPRAQCRWARRIRSNNGLPKIQHNLRGGVQS